MLRRLLILCAVLALAASVAPAQPSVRIEPATLHGPRPLADQTATSAIRNYIQSWQSLSAALDQNNPDLLDAGFTGDAKTKLAETIREQNALGIRTHYEDLAHDVQIVFYSPEGLSLELTDTVQYDVQLFDHDKPESKQQVRVRYVVMLTPDQVRWRVRVFQAMPSVHP
jgi:hypothetical protein